MKRSSAKANRKWLWPLLVVLAIVALGIVVGLTHQSKSAKSTGVTSNDYHPKASAGTGLSPQTTPSGSPTPTIQPSSGPNSSSDKAIVINAPTQGAAVADGTTVAGTATVSASVIYYRLKGVKSGQLADGSMSVTPGQATPFSFKLGFTNQVAAGGDQGELEIYATDSHGVETSIANVAVNIQG